MDWVTDIKKMHAKFGVHDWLDNSTPEDRSKLMKLRIRMLTEDMVKHYVYYRDAGGSLDGLIDLWRYWQLVLLDNRWCRAKPRRRSLLEANWPSRC